MDIRAFANREVRAVLQFFTSDHLPAEVRDIADGCANLAEGVAGLVGDHPQLQAGMQHLLDARAAFVRAALDQKGIIGAPPNTYTAPGPTGPLPVDPGAATDAQEPVQTAPGATGDSGPAGATLDNGPGSDPATVTAPDGVTRSPAESAALEYARAQGWEPAGLTDRVPLNTLGLMPPAGSPLAPFIEPAPVAAAAPASIPGRDHPITQPAP